MTGVHTMPGIQAATGAQAERLKRLVTIAAVATAAVLIAIKAWAWIMTGSVAMMASLVDSGLDLVASTLNLFAVRHALTPADREHRFGHGKAEALAGLGQATFIAGSSAFLFYESTARIMRPVPVEETAVGLGVIGASIALTLALVLFQRHVIRRTRSLAVGADYLHYVGDLASNGGVVVAFVLAGAFGWQIVDPIIGLLIAALIAFSSFRIFRGSYDELMDHELADAEREEIKRIVRTHAEVVNLHELRTRRAGHRAFIQMHLELPPDMPLIDAHRVSDAVEASILSAFPDAEVLIHQDPVGAEEHPKLALS